MVISPALIAIAFLVIFAVVLLVVSLGFRMLEVQRKSKVGGMLQTVVGGTASTTDSILKDDASLEARARSIDFKEIPFLAGMEENIRQAGLTWSPMGLLAAMGIGALIGALLGSLIRIPVFQQFSMIAFAFALGALPYVYVRMQRNKRLHMFEEQFPDALDFLARSMRAGHAFSVSLEMLADESPDPLGQEFRVVFHEQNLGAPIDDALQNLATRVPLLDVKFFVSAVLLQRETGGNLAEILTKLAYVIRERFRLKGQVRAASAHGRITALVLTFLPIVTMLALMVVAPGYLQSMADDPDGKYLIIGAIVGQIIGYFVMRRIIDIKV
jgi:tight adherence protein B